MYNLNKIVPVERAIDKICKMIDANVDLKKIKPLIEKLKEKGVLNYTEMRFHGGDTLLNYAIRKKKIMLAIFLLDNGADPAIPNNKNMNALTLLLEHYAPFLVLYGEDIYEKEGWSAERHENFYLIRRIIQKNPKVLQASLYGSVVSRLPCIHYGDTPLHLVASVKLLPIFLLLVLQGASLHQSNRYGETPLGRLQADCEEKQVEVPTENNIQIMAEKKFNAQLAYDNSFRKPGL